MDRHERKNQLVNGRKNVLFVIDYLSGLPNTYFILKKHVTIRFKFCPQNLSS